ncbi:MAG: LemA family protein [Candidatus Levybacteria bacterium]|nr:LemA family protein [Candidatus Levybacteria bacterium]
MLTAVIITSIVFLGIAFLLYLVVIFNNLQTVKNNITKAESNIKVLLKQRFDEIPQLVKICEEYMGYEANTLKELTNLRNTFNEKIKKDGQEAIDITEIDELDNKLNSQISKLQAVAENYPTLRASEHFLHLQTRISSLEEQISDRREFFNESVNTYNIRIGSLPDMLIANLLQYKKRALFDIDETNAIIPQTFNSTS